MARRHRRKKSGLRKNPKRVRSAKRAYKKSGLYKYNLRRKKKAGKRTKKYGKRKSSAKRHHRKHRAKASHKRRHGSRRKHYKRLSKAEARVARIQRKLARSSKHVVVVPKSELTGPQKSYLARLRDKLGRKDKALPLP